MAARVRSVGIACDGTLTMGVRVPYKHGIRTVSGFRKRHKSCFSAHVVVEQHESLVRLLISGSKSSLVQCGRLMSLMFGPNILEHGLQKGTGPVVTSVALDTVHHTGVPLGLLGVSHVQPLINGVGDTEEVVGVDLKR